MPRGCAHALRPLLQHTRLYEMPRDEVKLSEIRTGITTISGGTYYLARGRERGPEMMLAGAVRDWECCAMGRALTGVLKPARKQDITKPDGRDGRWNMPEPPEGGWDCERCKNRATDDENRGPKHTRKKGCASVKPTEGEDVAPAEASKHESPWAKEQAPGASAAPPPVPVAPADQAKLEPRERGKSRRPTGGRQTRPLKAHPSVRVRRA